MITTVIANGKDEYKFIETLKERSNSGAKDVSDIVLDIINNVKANGDKAVFDYTVKFDGKAPDKVEISAQDIDELIKELNDYGFNGGKISDTILVVHKK